MYAIFVLLLVCSGYLEETCKEAAQLFLETSPDLSEYRALAAQGRNYPTTVAGQSLVEILQGVGGGFSNRG